MGALHRRLGRLHPRPRRNHHRAPAGAAGRSPTRGGARMKLSCTDFTFHVLPHEKALELIAAIDLSHCDLLFFPGCRHVQAEEVLEDPAGTATKIRGRVEDAGLEVA